MDLLVQTVSPALVFITSIFIFLALQLDEPKSTYIVLVHVNVLCNVNSITISVVPVGLIDQYEGEPSNTLLMSTLF